MKGRILMVHMGGIGDFLCTLPALSQCHNEAVIEVAGIPERARLAELVGVSRATHDLEDIDFHTVFSTPSPRLQEFAVQFDHARIWMEDPDGVMTRNLVAAGIPDVRCLPGVPPKNWNRHAMDWYADGLNVSVARPASLDFGQSPTPYDVILQPGSGSPRKNWPLENFSEIANHLSARGLSVGWCCGPAESAIDTFDHQLPAMPLGKLAPLLAATKLYVGNDSGITHLASVTGCPTVAIFGPTNPQVWQPMGPRTTVIQGDPWPDTQKVFDAIEVRLAQSSK